MANFGRKMWGWKISLTGLSNTELQPFMPIGNGAISVATANPDIYFTGATYNTSLDDDGQPETGFLYLNGDSIDIKDAFGSWTIGASLRTNSKTVDGINSYSFDLESDSYGGSYADGNPDSYATLLVAAIRPLELETELQRPAPYMLWYAANNDSDQDNNRWPGYNAYLNADTLDGWSTGSEQPYRFHLKNVAGTQSLAARYHVSRIATDTPFNWNTRNGANEVYYGDNLTQNFWRTKDYFCSTDRPSGYDSITWYNWYLPYAGKAIKPAYDINGDPPDLRHGVDIAFEIELALQRYGVDTCTTTLTADQNRAFEPAYRNNPDYFLETLSYVAGHCCFGRSGSNNGQGDLLLVPVFLKMRTFTDTQTTGYDMSDLANAEAASTTSNRVFSINNLGARPYRYVVVAIKLERRFSTSSIVPGSGVVLDLENPSEYGTIYTRKSAFNICSGKNNGDGSLNDPWPRVRSRDAVYLFDKDFQTSSSFPDTRCQVSCLRVSEDAQYLFFSGGTMYNLPSGYTTTNDDVQWTRKFISRLQAPSDSDPSKRFFWHLTGNVGSGVISPLEDNTLRDPWQGISDANQRVDGIVQTLDFRYDHIRTPAFQVAPGYNGDPRVDNNHGSNDPDNNRYEAFIKSFRFSNDGKFLYILWVTDAILSNQVGNTIYQWVERWWTNEPKGYGSRNFRLGEFFTASNPSRMEDDGFFFAGTTKVHAIEGSSTFGNGYITSASSIDVTPDGLYLQVLGQENMVDTNLTEDYAKPVLLEYFLGGIDNSIKANDTAGVIGSTSPVMAQQWDRTIGNPIETFVWPNNIVSPGAYDASATYGNSDGSTVEYIVIEKSYRSQVEYRKLNSVTPSDMINCFGLSGHNVPVSKATSYPVPVDFSWSADGAELYLFGVGNGNQYGYDSEMAFREGNPFVFKMTAYPYYDDYPDVRIDEDDAPTRYDFLYLNRVKGLSNLSVSHGLTRNQGIVFPSTRQTSKTIIGVLECDDVNQKLIINGNLWDSFSPTLRKSPSNYPISYKLFVSDFTFINDTVTITDASNNILDETDGFYITTFNSPGESGAYIELRIDESATLTNFKIRVNGIIYMSVYCVKISWLEYASIPMFAGTQNGGIATNASSIIFEDPFTPIDDWDLTASYTDATGQKNAKNYNCVVPYNTAYNKHPWNVRANAFAYHKGGQYLYMSWIDASIFREDPDFPAGTSYLHTEYMAVYPIQNNVEEITDYVTNLPLYTYWGYPSNELYYQYKNWKWVPQSDSNVGPRIPGTNVADEGDCTPSVVNRDWGAMYLSSDYTNLDLNIISNQFDNTSSTLQGVKYQNYGPTRGCGYQNTIGLALEGPTASSRFRDKPYYTYSETNNQSEVQTFDSRSGIPIRHAFLNSGAQNKNLLVFMADIRGGKKGYWFGGAKPGSAIQMKNTIDWGRNNQNGSSLAALLNATFLSMNWCDTDEVREFLYLPKFKHASPAIRTIENFFAEQNTYYTFMQQLNEAENETKPLYIVSKKNYNPFAISSFDIAAYGKTPLSIPPNFLSYHHNGASLTAQQIYYEQQSDKSQSYYSETSNKVASVRSFRFADNGKKFFVLMSGRIEQVGGGITSYVGASLIRYDLSESYNLDTASFLNAYTIKEEDFAKSGWWVNGSGGSNFYSYFGSDFYMKPDGTRFWVIGLDSTKTSPFGQTLSSQSRVIVREYALSTPWDFSSISEQGFDTYDSQATTQRTSKIYVPVDLEVSLDGTKVYWSNQFTNTTNPYQKTDWGMEHWVSELQSPYDLKNPTDFTTSTVTSPLGGPVTRTTVGVPWDVEDGAAQKIRFVSKDRLYRNGISKPTTNNPSSSYKVTPNLPIGGISAHDIRGNNFQKDGGSFSIGNMGMFPTLENNPTSNGSGGARKNMSPFDMFIFAVNPEQNVAAISDTQLKIYHGIFNNNTKGF